MFVCVCVLKLFQSISKQTKKNPIQFNFKITINFNQTRSESIFNPETTTTTTKFGKARQTFSLSLFDKTYRWWFFIPFSIIDRFCYFSIFQIYSICQFFPKQQQQQKVWFHFILFSLSTKLFTFFNFLFFFSKDEVFSCLYANANGIKEGTKKIDDKIQFFNFSKKKKNSWKSYRFIVVTGLVCCQIDSSFWFFDYWLIKKKRKFKKKENFPGNCCQCFTWFIAGKNFLCKKMKQKSFL